MSVSEHPINAITDAVNKVVSTFEGEERLLPSTVSMHVHTLHTLVDMHGLVLPKIPVCSYDPKYGMTMTINSMFEAKVRTPSQLAQAKPPEQAMPIQLTDSHLVGWVQPVPVIDLNLH